MRLARATRAPVPGTPTEPDAVRLATAGAWRLCCPAALPMTRSSSSPANSSRGERLRSRRTSPRCDWVRAALVRCDRAAAGQQIVGIVPRLQELLAREQSSLVESIALFGGD